MQTSTHPAAKLHHPPAGFLALIIAVSAALVLTGLLLPAEAIVQMFRSAASTPPDMYLKLVQGAWLLKIGLAVGGVLLFALSRLNIWAAPAARVDPHPRRHLVILALILVAALALRLYSLNVGLWHDEIATYVSYVQIPFGEGVSLYDSENQHLLFTVLAQLAFKVFGPSGWALRLPAVLFGLGSVGAVYLLGRELGAPQEGLFAAALLTFSYHHIWFSQNARGYTGLLFFTLVSSWLLLQALRTNRPQTWVWYAATLALGIFTQLTMFFVVAAHLLIYLAALFTWGKTPKPGSRWFGLFLGFGLAAFFTLLIHALVLPQILSIVNEESTVPAWKRPLWTLLEFVQGMRIGFGSSVVAGGALLVFGLGLWRYARSRPVILTLLFVPAAVGTLVMIAAGHHLWPRFFLFIMGFAVLVVMRGITELARLGGRLLGLSPTVSGRVGLIMAAGMVLVSALSVPFVYGPKQDYQAALVYVQANQQPGDAVAVVGLAEFTYKNFYPTDWQVIESVDQLDRLRAGAAHAWLVYTFPPEVEAVYPDVMARITQDFILQQKFPGTLRNGTIYVTRNK